MKGKIKRLDSKACEKPGGPHPHRVDPTARPREERSSSQGPPQAEGQSGAPALHGATCWAALFQPPKGHVRNVLEFQIPHRGTRTCARERPSGARTSEASCPLALEGGSSQGAPSLRVTWGLPATNPAPLGQTLLCPVPGLEGSTD